jgi:hypothetical protein
VHEAQAQAQAIIRNDVMTRVSSILRRLRTKQAQTFMRVRLINGPTD